MFDGALFAVNAREARHLVALDLATGKERWRVPQPINPEPQIEFAKGIVFRNSWSSGQTEAVDVRSGRTLWTAKLCSFSNHPVDNGAVGFVLCHGPWITTKHPNGSSSSTGTTTLVAFDLANGRELWRRADWIGGNVAIGAQQVFVMREGKLRGLDPRTGRELQQIALPPGPPSPWQPWSVVGADVGGKPMALVNGGGDGRLTNRLVALGLPGASELWSRRYPQGRSNDVRGPTLQGGRLFEEGMQEITEVDVATGRVVLDCPLPRVDESSSYPRRWRLMHGEVVIIMEGGHEEPPVVVRCGTPQRKPTLAQLPRPATASYWKLVAAEDGIIVMRVDDELVAYRVFDTDPPEDVALSPVDRVRAILDRAMGHPKHTAGSIASNRHLYEELRAVPDVGRHLMTLIHGGHHPRRDRAVDAATALKVPGVVDVLLAEIFRAPAVPRVRTQAERLAGQPGTQRDPASEAYARSLARRADQIVLLAAMDDARAAARLGPLLLARSTPAGLGAWDWNIWGSWSEARYGMKAWDGASRTARRARLQPASTESGHSETLPAAAGRPEAHAAIYRLLARLGRREDLTRLDELDRATARGGGWAAICDADDAVTEPGPARVWVDVWGLCRGIDVGGYRVTQARNILWLRRRLANGSFGRPAWAHDPGGDQCNGQRTMQTATPEGDGHIVVRGTQAQGILANIDAAAVFADSDGDGLTDKTEAAFGTDPKRADTDRDGIPDGRDPAPLAKPMSDAADGQAAAEMLRFATLFLVGGPLTWQGDWASWGESPSAVGLLLHLPPTTGVDDQTCEGGQPGKPGEPERPRGVRTPFPVVSAQSLKITGERAQGRVIWSERGGRHAHDLGLAHVHGKWRVVDDRPVRNYR